MAPETEIHHADGRVELRDPEALVGSALYNHDLAPVAVAKRTWNTWDYAALWISMAHCIPTYMMASGLIAKGMAWWQALLTVLIGNLIVLVPILLNSHPGTKYGIPFPVFARAAFGTTGANLPALMRALVACGWFGINAWIGGAALQAFLASIVPGWDDLLGTLDGYPATQFVAFAAFWGLNILIIFRGMDLLRRVERLAAPFVLVMTAILVGWALWKAGGLGPLLERTSFDPPPNQDGTPSGATFGSVFVPSLTATIGFWSTLSLNMPDFTRFGRSQREQAIGQIVALPTTMTVFAAMGIAITSATVLIYGGAIAEPIALARKFDNQLVVAIAMFTVVIATLAVNIAANVVSPANDFANAFPKRVDFKRGGLITGVIGVAMMPWEMMKNTDRYFAWLGGYSGALGAVAGVLIVDYWYVRKTKLDLKSLYSRGGLYDYMDGWNLAAIGSTLLGATVALLGAFWDEMAVIYDWSWFVGFGLAAGAYAVTARVGTHRR
jgi:NCS1 family nucleobase:cation symporter-1|nr:NCS1 family nucleobase:cation symporter-1 [Kofleriaceae bacterium]